MKAVIYHADSHFAWGAAPRVGFYEGLFKKAKANFAEHGMTTIHLTLRGFPGWGDENFFYDGDPKDVVANREECFYQFLKDAPEDVYWFTEPDVTILRGFPGLRQFDLALCYRPGDDVPIAPAWRLARKSALPVFEECVEMMREDPRKDWHGDSAVFAKLWARMGKPKEKLVYKGLKIEMREYRLYVKGAHDPYTINALGPNKAK